MWQVEVSLPQIFDRPVRGREFFEEVIRDNLDLSRPDRVQLVFDRVVTMKTPGMFRTRVIQDGVNPSLHIEYKKFDLKQYFKKAMVVGPRARPHNPTRGCATRPPGIDPVVPMPPLRLLAGRKTTRWLQRDRGGELPPKSDRNRAEAQLDR